MGLPRNAALALVLLLVGLGGCGKKGPQETDRVLAIVGETRIRESDFRRELDRLDPSARTKYRRDRMDLLTRMIEEEVIYQKAVDENLTQDPDVRRRLVWEKEDISIERLKELQIYADIAVDQEEIEERYQEEIEKSGESRIVESLLYISNYQNLEPTKMISLIDKGLREGLSFPEIAERHSIPYDSMTFDSPDFSQLPAPIPNMTRKMPNRTVTALPLGGTPWYFVKDVEPLSSCFRRVRRAIRDEKRQKALREWLSSQRAQSTIVVHEEALKNMDKTDAVVAEVNDVPVTIEQLRLLREVLSANTKSGEKTTPEALLNRAVDREILRQEAWKRNLQENEVAEERMSRETRQILVETLTRREVTGITESVRNESRREWVTGLKKAAGVTVFPKNVKKMYLPRSEEIRNVFGVEPM